MILKIKDRLKNPDIAIATLLNKYIVGRMCRKIKMLHSAYVMLNVFAIKLIIVQHQLKIIFIWSIFDFCLYCFNITFVLTTVIFSSLF